MNQPKSPPTPAADAQPATEPRRHPDDPPSDDPDGAETRLLIQTLKTMRLREQAQKEAANKADEKDETK